MMTMKRCALLLALFCFSTRAGAQDIDSTYLQYGTMLRLRLTNAPFPDNTRAEGHTHEGQTYPAARHYTDSTVLVFVPKKFAQRSTADVVLYVHGWRNNVDSAMSRFHIFQQFVQADKNAILIVPEVAKDAPDSHGGKLERNGGLAALVNEVFNELGKRQLLKSARVGTVVLAGHSGAYRPLAYMAQQGGLPVSEIYLLDGLYGQTHKFARWVDKNPKARLLIIYTETGGTKVISEEFYADLKHWGLDPAFHKELDASLADLEKNRIIFLQSTSSHDEVVYKNNTLYKFLATSPNFKELE
jgi:hypothetical protein